MSATLRLFHHFFETNFINTIKILILLFKFDINVIQQDISAQKSSEFISVMYMYNYIVDITHFPLLLLQN